MPVNRRLEWLKLREYQAGQELLRLRRERPGSKELEDARREYHDALRALVIYQSFLSIFSQAAER